MLNRKVRGEGRDRREERCWRGRMLKEGEGR